MNPDEFLDIIQKEQHRLDQTGAFLKQQQTSFKSSNAQNLETAKLIIGANSQRPKAKMGVSVAFETACGVIVTLRHSERPRPSFTSP